MTQELLLILCGLVLVATFVGRRSGRGVKVPLLAAAFFSSRRWSSGI